MFDLKQPVRVKDTSEAGVVTGVAHFDPPHQPPYRVEFGHVGGRRLGWYWAHEIEAV